MRPHLFRAAVLASVAGLAAADPAAAQVPAPAPVSPAPAEVAPAPRPTAPIPELTPPTAPEAAMAAPGAPAPAAPSGPPPLDDEHTGPWYNGWIRGGYQLLWIKDAPNPTTTALSGAGAGAGRIGGRNIGYTGFDAIFLEGGFWLDKCHTFGFELGGFLSERQSSLSTLASDGGGSPAIVRPFFNPLVAGAGGRDGLFVAAPGVAAGAIAQEASARIDGWHARALINVVNDSDWTSNFVFGFRYFDLDEALATYQTTRPLPGVTLPAFGTTIAAPAVVSVTDRVRTRNQFYGGEFGGQFERRFGPVFLKADTTAGFGPVHQVTEVGGNTILSGAGAPQVFTGGVQAVGNDPVGNIGRLSTSRFAILSDVRLMAGLHLSKRARFGVGYDFLYLNTVARPGGQLSDTVDSRLVPLSGSFGDRIPGANVAVNPAAPPRTLVNRDDFFVHGVRFLFELTY